MEGEESAVRFGMEPRRDGRRGRDAECAAEEEGEEDGYEDGEGAGGEGVQRLCVGGIHEGFVCRWWAVGFEERVADVWRKSGMR